MAKQQSLGSAKMKEIRRAFDLWAKSVRHTNAHRLRVEKLIRTFPEKDRPLHEEQLQKYQDKIAIA